MSKLPRIGAIFQGAEPILKRLSKNERKGAEQAALGAGAARFFVDFTPLRFTRYATAKLDYRLRSGHLKRKRLFGVTDPLVWTGDTRASVLGRSRIAVAGTAGHPTADLKMPLPGPRPEVVVKTLSAVLESELAGFAQVAGQVLTELLGQASSVGGKSKKLTLTGAKSAVTNSRYARARGHSS